MTPSTSRLDTSRAINILSAVVVVFFVAIALYWARAIFIPLTMAIFLSFILSPLVKMLQRRRLGRIPSVMVVVLIAMAISGGVGTIVGGQLVQLTKTLPDHADKIKGKIASAKEMISSDGNSRLARLVNEIQVIVVGEEEEATIAADGTIKADGDEKKPKVVVKEKNSWIDRAQMLASPAAEVLGQAAFTFILVIFMLLKREDLRNRMIRLLGEGQVTTTTKAVDEASRRISRYLLVQFLLNAAFGMAIVVGLLIMQVPYAPLWGFTAFLMRYVPYIGTWIGVVPPALFAFAISDGWGLPIGVLALFLGLELICNNFVEPVLYGTHLGLSEVAQLVATAFWALLWGPVGMILAWPLTSCLLVLGKYVPQFRFLNILLGDQPVLSPQVAFYQRLAARDQDEADKIVEKELKSQPTEKVFDSLLISTLVEAGQDTLDGRISETELAYVNAGVREFAEHLGEFSKIDAGKIATKDRVRIMIAPARNLMEQVGGELLAGVLESDLWEIEVVPTNTLTAELLDRIEQSDPAMFVLTSLPPGGLTHTRFLCKRIRSRFPDLKIIIGRWSISDELDELAMKQLREAGADEIAKSLMETRTVLSGWRAVFAASPAAEKVTPRERTDPIGMARA